MSRAIPPASRLSPAALGRFSASASRLLGGGGMRLEKALQRISRDDLMDLEFVIQDALPEQRDLRIHQRFNGDISGRFLGLFSAASLSGREVPEQFHRLAERLFELTHEDGSYGFRTGKEINGPKLYGNGRLLVGFCEYYAAAGDRRALERARGIAGYFEGLFDAVLNEADELSLGFCFQTLEGLACLYEACGDGNVLRFARRLCEGFWEEPKSHAHSYLTTLCGMGRLYLATGDSYYRDALLPRYERVARLVYPDGNVSEEFPNKPRNEACTLADWIALNLYLGQAEGDAVYFERAERTWRNAFCATQFQNFGFGHHWYLGGSENLGCATDGEEAWWCCSYHGPRLLLRLEEHLFALGGKSVDVNYLADARLSDEAYQLRVATDFPSGEAVSIEIDRWAGPAADLRVRIPAHVDERAIRVERGGEPIAAELAGGYLVLRDAAPGNAFELSFPMPLRLFDAASGAEVTDWASGDELERAMIWRGPLLLGYSPPREIPLRDQAVELPAFSAETGGLALEPYQPTATLLDSGSFRQKGYNIYGLHHFPAHCRVAVRSRANPERRFEKDLYPLSEQTRRRCDFRTVLRAAAVSPHA